MGDNFKYEIGEIYLDTEPADDDNEEINYVMKQIVSRQKMHNKENIYGYRFWSRRYLEEITGWDSEHSVDVGKILLGFYLKGRNT